MSRTLAKRVADHVNRDWGERVCSVEDVQRVYRGEDLPDRESVASRILQEFEELGVAP